MRYFKGSEAIDHAVDRSRSTVIPLPADDDDPKIALLRQAAAIAEA